jgi:hypothetical protein
MGMCIIKTQLNIGGIIYYLRHNYMFRLQYVGHLQVVHEFINKLYKHVVGGYIEGYFGKVQDLVSERGKGAWTGDYDFRRFGQYCLKRLIS